MPKIIIDEKDLTNAEATQYDDSIVLIPGTLGSGGESGATPSYDPETDGREVEFKDLSTFNKKILGVEKSSVSELASTSAQLMASYLLSLGMTVLYRVIDSESDLNSEDFWKDYQDLGKYNIRFITDGGYIASTLGATEADVKIAQWMIECAAERGDAIALVDVPQNTALGKSEVTAIQEFINSLSVSPVERDFGATQHIENAFKYAACFAERVTWKNQEKELPGSFAYLACFARHTVRFPDWFAMAGSVRGVLPFDEVKVSYIFGSAEIDDLQKRSVTSGAQFKAVNPITEIRPYGKIVWGNRTLYPIGIANDTDEIQTGLTASSFLNIRNICCDIKKTLFRVARKYTFEPNSDVLWTNFKSDIKPLLESMKSGQGIRGYDIIRTKTDKKATLTATIKIIPIEAVEDFDLTVELSDSISVTE